jgi:2-amino-4-hydroxy-6-hydroxymethyldihydropteridine diphosphokinase
VSRFPVAIAIGSNLGNRRGHLEYAIQALAPQLTNLEASTFIETEPAGVRPGQPSYLNAAVAGATTLSPRALLDRLLEIEQERGRERPHPKAPRTLDLDLILYGAWIVEEEGLSIPHPRFREREFVLGPLAEIAPELIDPVSGQTVSQLLLRLKEPAGRRDSSPSALFKP